MSKDIYILYGTTGCYSDTLRWTVECFFDENLAIKKRDALRSLLTEYNGNHTRAGRSEYGVPGTEREYLKTEIPEEDATERLNYLLDEYITEPVLAAQILKKFKELDPQFDCNHSGIYYWLEKHTIEDK